MVVDQAAGSQPRCLSGGNRKSGGYQSPDSKAVRQVGQSSIPDEVAKGRKKAPVYQDYSAILPAARRSHRRISTRAATRRSRAGKDLGLPCFFLAGATGSPTCLSSPFWSTFCCVSGLFFCQLSGIPAFELLFQKWYNFGLT